MTSGRLVPLELGDNRKTARVNIVDQVIVTKKGDGGMRRCGRGMDKQCQDTQNREKQPGG